MNRSLLLVWCFALLTSTVLLSAQNPKEQPEQTAISGTTSDQVKSQLSLIEATEGMEPKAKENLIGLYKLALERLESATRFKLEADHYRQLIETSADTITSLKSQLAVLPTLNGSNEQTNHIADIKGDISSKEIEQLLTSEKAKLTDLRSTLSTTEANIQAQVARPEKNRLELEEARKNLAEINASLAAPPVENEKPQETRARLMVLESRRQARSNEIVKLEQETTSHELRLNVKKANRDLQQRQVALLEARVMSLESRLSTVKQMEVN